MKKPRSKKPKNPRTPHHQRRLMVNPCLMKALRAVTGRLRKAGLGVSLYVTGNYSNEKKWGVFTLNQGRPRISDSCVYLSDTFSRVGKTDRCRAYRELLALAKAVPGISKRLKTCKSLRNDGGGLPADGHAKAPRARGQQTSAGSSF